METNRNNKQGGRAAQAFSLVGFVLMVLSGFWAVLVVLGTVLVVLAQALLVVATVAFRLGAAMLKLARLW